MVIDGDPNRAGILAEYRLELPTGTRQWFPRVGKRGEETDLVAIPLERGGTYNLRALEAPPEHLEVGCFYGEREPIESLVIARTDLASAKGYDLYPSRDAILVARWAADTPAGSTVPIRVTRLAISKADRLKDRELEMATIDP